MLHEGRIGQVARILFLAAQWWQQLLQLLQLSGSTSAG